MELSGNLSLRQSQTMSLTPRMRQSLGMLAMNIPELREELHREMAVNPVIDDIDQTLERETLSERERETEAKEESLDNGYPDDDPVSGSPYASDEEAQERRQKFFDSQKSEETLERHLASQLESSGLDAHDIPLAEILIGELNQDGLFTGSIPDIMMVTGESREKILSVLGIISTLDPAGCGTRSLAECLLAQIDKLDGSPYRDEVREILEKGHLQDIADGNLAAVEKDLGTSPERMEDVLAALRTLDPRPARAYDRSGKSAAYINPEVHAVFSRGKWVAVVDARSLPEIHISKKYLKMLEDPHTDAKTREYIRGKIESVKALVEAVEKREETITAIAQEIFDRQPGFFKEGLKGLKPLSMQDVAEAVGCHHSTVSRTVNDKYASTPVGTVELRRFFVAGYQSASEGEVTLDAVLAALKSIIDGEDKSSPYSDDTLSRLMKDAGFDVARRTVAKYRGKLGIPSASERKAAGSSARKEGASQIAR